MGKIELSQVEKWFGETQVIKGINLKIVDGEFLVFVGPSGCGKSTLLRMIGGLEETSRGNIFIDGADVTNQPPSKRGLSMVFQSYALYPHLNVQENMGFPLKTAGATKSQINESVMRVAKILKLEHYLKRLPKTLSGGQRQRVAIGRSIVRNPTAFLFDEPLSNLDAALRVDMRLEIAKMHRDLGSTMIYVTHDQVEAMTLADRIAVLDSGSISQVGSPKELYDFPGNLFVAQFIGSPKMNILSYLEISKRLEKEARGRKAINSYETANHVGIRAEHIQIVPVGKGNFDAVVDVVEYLGAETFLIAHADGLGDIRIRAAADSRADISSGAKIGLRFDISKIHFFDSDGIRV